MGKRRLMWGNSSSEYGRRQSGSSNCSVVFWLAGFTRCLFFSLLSLQVVYYQLERE